MEIKPHTPSAGGVVIFDNKVLLIHSSSLNSYAFPKGTIDNDETKEMTALREVKEETGYNVQIIDNLGESTYIFNGKDGFQYRKTVSYYLMELADDAQPEPNLQEGEDFTNSWVSIEEAMKLLTFDESREILEAAINRLSLT